MIMPLATDELSKNAMGGTELMKYALESRLDKELLDEVQIVCSRVRELDESKLRIFWAHDLPGDPESEFLRGGGWDKFHRLVFVSNWQMQAYIQAYNIPWSKCIVLQNAITPIEEHEKPTDKIRLAYWSTPHRGLNIVVPVFNKLAEQYDNIELDVFSSFDIYGWPERDEPYKDLFQACKDHPKINYHGSVPNEQIHEYLKTAHILAYPSIWPETSCIVLMEAMSAGLLCVHPNLAALPETAANWTMMYQFDEDLQRHAQSFYNTMKACIENLNDPGVQSRIASQSSYTNVFYNWEVRARQWDVFLRSLLDEPREFPKEQFVYSPS
jgi:glycosyltransferase involved in cell wall biosynthesis